MKTGPESGVYLSFYEWRTLDVALQVLRSQLMIEQAAGHLLLSAENHDKTPIRASSRDTGPGMQIARCALG